MDVTRRLGISLTDGFVAPPTRSPAIRVESPVRDVGVSDAPLRVVPPPVCDPALALGAVPRPTSRPCPRRGRPEYPTCQ